MGGVARKRSQLGSAAAVREKETGWEGERERQIFGTQGKYDALRVRKSPRYAATKGAAFPRSLPSSLGKTRRAAGGHRRESVDGRVNAFTNFTFIAILQPWYGDLYRCCVKQTAERRRRAELLVASRGWAVDVTSPDAGRVTSYFSDRISRTWLQSLSSCFFFFVTSHIM